MTQALIGPLHLPASTLYSAETVDQALLLRLSVEGLYSVVDQILVQIRNLKAPGGKRAHGDGFLS
ncbi:hypothetical protein [Nonomuraea typhae]|uniref:Tn3 transposase DDE domain-containing protein n=1 Tax=Nonomuraea typhae TaxID=2603600 RepID=A0ABW7YY11_9ACTN